MIQFHLVAFAKIHKPDLQERAITGNIEYGIPQIKSRAKQVEPPPKPTLEYSVAVTKNNIARNAIFNYSIIQT